jgi:hypothetical protein
MLTPAQRGRIVQHIIVDGWTSTEAAAAFGLPERVIDAWVADYRRHGMASLRDRPWQTMAAEIVRLRLLRPVRAVFRGISIGLRRLSVRERSVPPSPLHRFQDDRRGGGEA